MRVFLAKIAMVAGLAAAGAGLVLGASAAAGTQGLGRAVVSAGPILEAGWRGDGEPGAPPSAASEKEQSVLIRWNLFEGVASKETRMPQIVMSSASKVPAHSGGGPAASTMDVGAIRRDLVSIYQLDSVESLMSDESVWIRSDKKVLNTLLLQGASLPISITPKKTSGSQVQLHVQISKLAENEVGGGTSIVDTEFVSSWNEPVVLGFNVENRKYFLAVEASLGGASGTLSSSDSALRQFAFLPTPRPLVQVTPQYPEACRAAGIGGKVVLRVDADADGKVIRVDVLKGVHPDLDRAAREAIAQWRYEPVRQDGKRVPVTFSVSVDFNAARGAASNQKTPAAEPAAAAPAPPVRAPARTSDDPVVAKILEKTAAYCERLKRAGLNFVCREDIEEELGSSSNSAGLNIAYIIMGGNPEEDKAPARMRLSYDYQLIKKGDSVTDVRNLIEENGIKKDEKNVPLKTRRFRSFRAVFGPVGLLAREWQGSYEYKLLSDEKIEGRPAYVLEVRPRAAVEERPNYGKIWIDRETFAVLRIDVEQESLVGFEKAQQWAAANKYKPVFNTSHVFGAEKNGVRFPSRTTFVEAYKRTRPSKYHGEPVKTQVSQTVIVYRDYKFFTVDVDVSY